MSMIVFAGVTVPKAFETCAKATILVRQVQQFAELIEKQRTVVVDRGDAEFGSL